jgi:catechol 2,3-dioxygenase-like lactoylglutathione lyase family enzyme
MGQHEDLTHTTSDASPARLPATLRLGAVYLTVSDLDRSVAFYEDAIGLRLHRREDSVAVMGAGEEEVEAVRERVRAAGVEVEDEGEGFLVREDLGHRCGLHSHLVANVDFRYDYFPMGGRAGSSNHEEGQEIALRYQGLDVEGLADRRHKNPWRCPRQSLS